MVSKAMEKRTKKDVIQEFRNEPFTDFSIPQNREAMQEAIEWVRSRLGQEYDLLIGGEKA